MAKKRDANKLRPDVSETAYRTLQEALGERPKTVPPEERTEEERDPRAVARGRKGGKKGGRSRADLLTPDELSDMARKAATARWEKARTGDTPDDESA